MSELRLGVAGTGRMLHGELDARRALVARVAAARLDHVFVADHVSFHGGTGMDGIVQAASLAALHPSLEVHVGVYLLPLRHPVLVARELATLAESAPGRIAFGVGVGGEDRHEVEVCGVDPATRGRRTDESLAVLRPLLAGEPVSHRGEFFAFERARILPAPDPAIPIFVGGRSPAALRRAARFGDGWLGIWSSARRYAQAVARIDELATAAGRANVRWRHGLQLWAGSGAQLGRARERLGAAMQRLYQLPFERFERYSPCGPPEAIAEFLQPYVAAGCRSFNLLVVGESEEASIEVAGEVRRLLIRESARAAQPLTVA